MIVRSWSARLLPDRADDYVAFFQRVIRPQLDALSGFREAEILISPERAEVVVLTRWESMGAVRQFAGDDPSRAVVEPEAVALFSDYDRAVRHYEVVEG